MAIIKNPLTIMQGGGEFVGTVFGVEWTKGSNTSVLTRTDDAENFDKLQPSILPEVGTNIGCSPFDNQKPWKDIEEVEDETAGTLVKIPKFWYKWTETDTKIKLQISNVQNDGFLTSPAHSDRGDGSGERDFVYVGKYFCANDYKSTSGVNAKTGTSLETFRSGIHSLGSNYWQYDFAMHQTISMLAFVEIGSFSYAQLFNNGQPMSDTVVNGDTDKISYSTGKNAKRTSVGSKSKYRHIEGIFDSFGTWLDGVRFANDKIYVNMTPSTYSSTTGGVEIGSIPPGVDKHVSDFKVLSNDAISFCFPKTVQTNDISGAYYPMYANENKNTVITCGYKDGSWCWGFLYYNSSSWASGGGIGRTGGRLIKLP